MFPPIFRRYRKFDGLAIALRAVERLENFHGLAAFLAGYGGVAALHDGLEEFGNLELVIVFDGINAEKEVRIFLLPLFQ